jgi:GR25 family glycosyltransferase involved in LPS biosynthesis
MLIEDSHICFVNLDHRIDRLNHMENQLSQVGLTAYRVRGLLPSEINNSRVEVMRRRTPGAIGCHFSQVSIMQSALEQGKHAWVMEDDLVFCKDFHERVKIMDEFLSVNEWDIMWLGATFHVPSYWHPLGLSRMKPDCSAHLGRDYEPTSNPRIMRTFGAFCTYAYIVNVKSIQKVLDLLDRHLHESIGIDWLMIKIQPQLKCFAFVPGSVKQMDNQSDIGTGVTNFSGFAKLNGSVENSRYWFQEYMSDFKPESFAWK